MLSNYDVTKIEEVYRRPLYEVFFHLLYMEDKAVDDRKKAFEQQARMK